MDWIDSDWKSMFGGPCGFVWEKSGAGGLGIFITHSLAARRIEAQYQRNNRKYIRRLFFFTDLQVDSCDFLVQGLIMKTIKKSEPSFLEFSKLKCDFKCQRCVSSETIIFQLIAEI